jgi:hypothetical protein
MITAALAINDALFVAVSTKQRKHTYIPGKIMFRKIVAGVIPLSGRDRWHCCGVTRLRLLYAAMPRREARRGIAVM